MNFGATDIKNMADAARGDALYAVHCGASGHIGIALGAADIVTTVFANHLRFDPKNPNWPDRDRFVLSAGHGSALLYAVLKLAGYNVPNLSGFRVFGSPLAGHPEYGSVPGVESTTGPLGQGVANAIGIAMAGKIRAARKMGPEYKTYVLCSDGDLMEGVANEAIALAGYYKLNNLILMWDDNGVSIDGAAVNELDIPLRMRAAGFEVVKVDGHNPREINAAIERAKKSKKPTFIQCKTIIGLGAPNAGTHAAHALTLSPEQIAALSDKYKNDAGRRLWHGLANQNAGMAPAEIIDEKRVALAPIFEKLYSDSAANQSMATRDVNQIVLECIAEFIPELIGGNADLAESTRTHTKNMHDIAPNDFTGNYINYGVREHGMAAIMNGLSLSGFRPFGGTFLIFSDYMRPAIRLSAIMKQPVIYVFTHDSIALGQDGPTHQPVEQLASLRMIPDMNVIRPADYIETVAAWDIAINDVSRPHCLVQSRQKLPQITGTSAAGVRQGGYVVKKSEIENKKSKITLVATGSEVSLAIQVADILATKKIAANVVSLPSVDIFRGQTESYRNKILTGTVIAIEAAASGAWFEFADAVVGIDSFGTNGDGSVIYKHFGFDASLIADEIAAGIK